MKRLLITALLALGLAAGTRAEIIQPGDRPNRTQQLMQQRGYGMFIHFGVNTFDEKEWSDGTIPASRYNPTHLDCDQWVRVARDAGFRYVLLVTKHHDGFCLWDSKLTDYDVASSPVKTDVVGAVAAACRKYGLGLAFYYSCSRSTATSAKSGSTAAGTASLPTGSSTASTGSSRSTSPTAP